MRKSEQWQQEQIPEDEQIEIIDLGFPDGGGLSTWLSSTLLQWQRSAQRRHWQAGFSLALALPLTIFCLLNTAFYAHVSALFRRPASFSAIPRPSPSRQGQDGMACLVDAAWSPDAHFIAVLGYRQDCRQTLGAPAVLNLYELHAAGPVLKRQLSLDSALLARRFPLPFPSEHIGQGGALAAMIAYTHILWSPDGHRLACTFFIQADPPAHGVVLMNSDGATPQILLTQQALSSPFSEEWQLSPQRTHASPRPRSLSVPAALAYYWGANGALTPDGRLADQTLPASSSVGPVGNPDGDPSFSIWQPGVLSTMWGGTFSPRGSRLSTTWKTSFAAWSPDGRSLLEGIDLSVLLKPQEQVEASQRAGCLSHQALLPPVGEEDFLQGFSLEEALAWSLSGQALAAYTPGKGIALYSCSDGYQLASSLLSAPDAASPAGSIALRWSHDGAHLLFCSAQGHLVILTGMVILGYW
jgi:hypothetical protein